MLRYFIDSDAKEVKATLSHKGKTYVEVEDTSEGIILFENGIKAIYYFTNNYIGFQPPRIVLNCENGSAEIKGVDATITYNDGRLQTLNATEELKLIGKQCYGYGHFLQIKDFYGEN